MCKYFAIYDTENMKLENINYHTNKDFNIANEILKYNPNLIFSLGIGQKAINFFKEKNIILKTGDYNI